MMSPVEFGLETVYRPIIVALGMISPSTVPLKFVNRRFIPFIKLAAAIPMTLADSLALGP
jgi:hypothetical protein